MKDKRRQQLKLHIYQSSSSLPLLLTFRAPDPNFRFLNVTFWGSLSLSLARVLTRFSLKRPLCFSFGSCGLISFGGAGSGISSIGSGSGGNSGSAGSSGSQGSSKSGSSLQRKQTRMIYFSFPIKWCRVIYNIYRHPKISFSLLGHPASFIGPNNEMYCHLLSDQIIFYQKIRQIRQFQELRYIQT